MMYLLALAALLPVAVILWFVYYRDKDKEPIRTLAITFFWGCMTVIPAMIMENVFDNEDKPFVEYFLVVAPTEELLKFSVVMLYIWKHKDFDDSFDAIVYCVTASLGFAAVENLFYVFENGLDVAIARAITSIPGHAAFAVLMGFFIAKAKTHFYYNRKGKQCQQLLIGVMTAILVHGFYDYLVATQRLILFSITILILDTLSVFLIIRASKYDRAMIIDE